MYQFIHDDTSNTWGNDFSETFKEIVLLDEQETIIDYSELGIIDIQTFEIKLQSKKLLIQFFNFANNYIEEDDDLECLIGIFSGILDEANEKQMFTQKL